MIYYARAYRFELHLLPPASSLLNPIETVWSRVKDTWRKENLSRASGEINPRDLEYEVGSVLERVSASFTDKI